MVTLKSRMIFGMLLIALAVPTSVSAQATNRSSRASISTTICEFLGNPSQFDKKKLKFRARYGGTWEGMWVSDDACDGSGELILPGDSDIAKVYGIATLAKQAERLVRDDSWKQFESLARNLSTGLEISHKGIERQPKYPYLVADFEGTVVIRRNFRFKNGFGNGWGHLGASRFLLILRSVSDVSAHPLDPVILH